MSQARAQARAGKAPVVMAQQMLEARPFPLLIRLASPNALAFLVQAAVSMAEVGFVARLGTVPLAALALTFPGLMLMQMLANGAIGGAVSSAVARTLGADDPAKAESLIWHALVIALAAGGCFYAFWLATGPALLALLGATAHVQEAASGYAGIVFGGSFALWTTAMLSSVFRGMGNMRVPAALMIGGALVQIPLAGTLIFGWFGMPRLGLNGAAAAVICVAAVNSCIQLYLLQRRQSPLRLKRKRLVLRAALFGNIFKVGALAALSPVFTVLTIGLINGLVSAYGVDALAGYGIVARLEFLLVPMVFGLGAAMTAMVGTNIGAGKIDRAERIGWLGCAAAAAVTGLVGGVLALFPGLWLNLFTEVPSIRAAGESYLHIVGPFFLFQGIGLSLYFASQGAGTVFWPVMATVLRFVIGVGGAALAVHRLSLDLEAVYACLAAGMFVYGTLTAASLRLGAWRRGGTW